MARAHLSSRLATIGVIAFVAITLVEHALVPRLEPAHYMISEYANVGGIAGAAGAVALAAWGGSFLACAALGWAVGANIAERTVSSRALAALLLMAGLGFIVAAVCPTQAVRGVVPVGEHLRLAGRLHDLGSGIGQLSIFGAAIVSGRIFAAHRSFHRATVALVATGLLVGPTFAVLGVGDRGLRQRALVAGACVWELGLIGVLDRSRRAEESAE